MALNTLGVIIHTNTKNMVTLKSLPTKIRILFPIPLQEGCGDKIYKLILCNLLHFPITFSTTPDLRFASHPRLPQVYGSAFICLVTSRSLSVIKLIRKCRES